MRYKNHNMLDVQVSMYTSWRRLDWFIFRSIFGAFKIVSDQTILYVQIF